MLVKLITERVAFLAVKQIEEATLKLNIHIVRELGVRNFPFTVIHAWTEESLSTTQDYNSKLIELPIVEARHSFLHPRNYLTKEQAIRLSRYVFLFGIFPAIFVIFILSAENINRCQFHQHYMCSFLIRKFFFVQLCSMSVIPNRGVVANWGAVRMCQGCRQLLDLLMCLAKLEVICR